MGSALAIPAALALAATTLLWLRLRRLGRPLPRAVDVESPLAPSELLRLDRWRRRLRGAAIAVLASYVVLAGLALLGADAAPGRSLVGLWLLGLVCLLGAAVQFSERCPRCGFNLGFQSRWSLPDACDRCSGAYR